MYNYAKFRVPGPRAAAKSKKKERGNFFPLVIIVILECDCNLLEDYEADFLTIDVARSEGAIFNVSNSHFFISLSFFSVFIIPYFWLFVNRFLKSF